MVYLPICVEIQKATMFILICYSGKAKIGKQGSDDSIKQLSTQPLHAIYDEERLYAAWLCL